MLQYNQDRKPERTIVIPKILTGLVVHFLSYVLPSLPISLSGLASGKQVETGRGVWEGLKAAPSRTAAFSWGGSTTSCVLVSPRE